jgi:hypothetical protein
LTALQTINLGTPPAASDGDTVRTALTKVNSNVGVLSTQAALTSATAITQPQALTSQHVGKRVNINLSTEGTVNVPEASMCAPDQVILLRNVGTAVALLAITAGSGDTLSLSKLNPGESAVLDTDGVHTWAVLIRGRTDSDDETVNGNCTVGGNGSVAGSLAVGTTLGVTGLLTATGGVSIGTTGQATISSGGAYSGVSAAYSGNVSIGGTLTVSGAAEFTQRPSFGVNTPWDSANLAYPASLDASGNLAIVGTLTSSAALTAVGTQNFNVSASGVRPQFKIQSSDQTGYSYLRSGTSGGIEFVNSAYSAATFSVDNSGNAQVFGPQTVLSPGGTVMLSTTSSDPIAAHSPGATVRPGGSLDVWSTTNPLYLGSASTGLVMFFNGATPSAAVGSITTNGAQTYYNTTSDYRLKENVQPISGVRQTIESVKARHFSFIADPDKEVVAGFLAHELAASLPDAVHGEKDAVDDKGEILAQSVDYSKLTPYLWQAVTDLYAALDAANARIAALGASYA